jgi:hypothetical protein
MRAFYAICRICVTEASPAQSGKSVRSLPGELTELPAPSAHISLAWFRRSVIVRIKWDMRT